MEGGKKGEKNGEKGKGTVKGNKGWEVILLGLRKNTIEGWAFFWATVNK